MSNALAQWWQDRAKSLSPTNTPEEIPYWKKKVPSATRDEVDYEVTVYPSDATKNVCTCPAFIYRSELHGPCKHLKSVVATA